jgi:hypothetical protein
MRVRLCGVSVDCVHQDGTAPDDFRTGVGTLQGIFQESRAETLALLAFVHSQASKQNYSDRLRR